ncbi:MAG: hypothetical protein AB7V74_26825, partial [Acidimicrobiia bacterium]
MLTGRDEVIAEVAAVLRSDGRVVVVGTGGVGKSTLARAVVDLFGADEVVWLDIDLPLVGQALGPLLLDSIGDRA